MDAELKAKGRTTVTGDVDAVASCTTTGCFPAKGCTGSAPQQCLGNLFANFASGDAGYGGFKSDGWALATGVSCGLAQGGIDKSTMGSPADSTLDRDLAGTARFGVQPPSIGAYEAVTCTKP
jgi:hypothetical protein